MEGQRETQTTCATWAATQLVCTQVCLLLFPESLYSVFGMLKQFDFASLVKKQVVIVTKSESAPS